MLFENKTVCKTSTPVTEPGCQLPELSFQRYILPWSLPTTTVLTCFISCVLQFPTISHSSWPTHRVIKNDCRGHTQYTPDATPGDFFLWDYVKDRVHVPLHPASIPELEVRIRTTIETITVDKLQIVWNELDYRVDVCRITKGAHIDHL